MKVTNPLFSLRLAAVLMAACGYSFSHATAQTVNQASLTISATTNVTVTVQDPSNHVWLVQSSVDFQEWSEVGAWKIYNGSFHGSFDNSAPARFFRAYYDPARDGVVNTADLALRLPEVAFNYASPSLPPKFSQPP